MRRKTRRLAGLAAVAGLGVGALLALLVLAPSDGSRTADGSRTGDASRTSDDHGAPIEGLRTILASRVEHDVISQPGQPLHAVILEGDLPDASVVATVRTDEDCTPDAAGISRCTNRIELPGGDEVVLRHPHRMSEVACLAPGERVILEHVA